MKIILHPLYPHLTVGFQLELNFALSFAGKNFHDFLHGKPLQSYNSKETHFDQGIELLHVSFGKSDSSRKSSFSYGKSCPDSRRKRFCHQEDDIESMMKTDLEVAQICRDELPSELSNDNSVRLFCDLLSLYINRA